MTLGDVLFDTARSNLKSGGVQNIYPLVEYLKRHAETMVKIDGHTDSKGSSDYNLNLSQMRAEAVRTFLITNGISPQRISAQGMGEDYPVATNSTAAGRQQNRRVEVSITESPPTMTPSSFWRRHVNNNLSGCLSRDKSAALISAEASGVFDDFAGHRLFV